MNESGEPNKEVIHAAGGIVERQVSTGLEIVLIHRTRYGSEWCLPKGKLKKQESWKEAALREVKEETGCECSIKGIAGAISYIVNKTPKIVLFWKMDIKGDSAFKPNKEVDKLEWLSPFKALSRLQRPEEIALIKQVYSGSISPSSHYGVLQRIKSFAVRLFQTRRWSRLESAIVVYKNELCRHLRSSTSTNPGDASWVEPAFNLLGQAELALGEGNIDKGWKCFLGAQRMEIFAFNTKEELSAKVKVLREEADKLRSWRKKATEHLLGTPESPKNVRDKAIVYEATLIRDEHFNNQAYKDSLKRDHNLTLSFILGGTLISMFWMMGNDVISLGKDANQNSWQMFTSVTFFGLLGGVVSAILKTVDTDQSSRIPEIVTGMRVTLLRIFVGTASAIVAFIFLKSQFAHVFIDSITKLKSLTPYTIYAISFTAGFTERLVLRAVESVAGKGK